MDVNKRRMLMKVFIILQYSYWKILKKVNKIHEKALRLVYDENPYLTFDKSLIKDKSVSIH